MLIFCSPRLKNTVKTVILWNISVMRSCIFSIITPVFGVTWSFRNHANMQIYCSRNSSYYYVENSYAQDYLMNRKFKITAFICYINFCNIINVFTDTFDEFLLNASLLNKSISFFKKPFEWQFMSTTMIISQYWMSHESVSMIRGHLNCVLNTSAAVKGACPSGLGSEDPPPALSDGCDCETNLQLFNQISTLLNHLHFFHCVQRSFRWPIKWT